jgi:beta-galactosidase/beta-glucuronidase
MKNSLTTAYAEKMDKSCPWADYPRPSLVRDSYICLNGLWDFAYSKDEPAEYKEKILVPFSPECALSGIERGHTDEELIYYRRNFTLPEGFIKDKVILHFGAVDQICSVYINGSLAGGHKGGYTPFSLDITEYVSLGENTISVVCEDTLSNIYPYGKQTKKRGGMWYTPVSAIWQTVWLESVPENYIKGLKITPTVSSVKIEVIGAAGKKRLTLKEGGSVYEFTESEITLTPEKATLWTPETPHLYYFTLETETDRVESYFALREISTAKIDGVTRLTLNGKPYLFNGLLDQGYFPDGLFLPATADGYIDDIMTAKSLGFNMLRKHIKIEPEIFYYLCDKLGMAVFQDMVNNSDYSFLRDTALPTVCLKRLPDKRLHRNEESRKIYRETMKRTIELLHNFPSVVYYTLFNEGWGQFTADDIYEEARALDGTRIYDATSGWFWQKKSDVDSYHIYFKRLKIKDNPDRPIVISEFGGYSHRVSGHLFGEGNYGYKSFKSREEFEAAVRKLYTNEVLPLIPRGVSALVYTQLSDIEDETNGFLTYDRRVLKVDAEKFKSIMKRLEEN